LLLHLKVRWKVFHFPSVDMLYDVRHIWEHVQRHAVYLLTWSVVSFSGCCESCWLVITFHPALKEYWGIQNSKFINQKSLIYLLKECKTRIIFRFSWYLGNSEGCDTVKIPVKSSTVISLFFVWMNWICVLDEHQGVVLQHGGWAGGWECTIENWHITTCHGESRVLWVVKWMEKHECLSTLLINSVQGNKKMVESLQNMIRKPVSMFKKIWQWRYLDYKSWRDVPLFPFFFSFLFSFFFLIFLSLSFFLGWGVSKSHPIVVYHVRIDIQAAVTHNKFY